MKLQSWRVSFLQSHYWVGNGIAALSKYFIQVTGTWFDNVTILPLIVAKEWSYLVLHKSNFISCVASKYYIPTSRYRTWKTTFPSTFLLWISSCNRKVWFNNVAEKRWWINENGRELITYSPSSWYLVWKCFLKGDVVFKNVFFLHFGLSGTWTVQGVSIGACVNGPVCCIDKAQRRRRPDVGSLDGMSWISPSNKKSITNKSKEIVWSEGSTEKRACTIYV